MFTIPVFLAGPGFYGGGTILDGVAQPRPTFVLFASGFFDTSAFHLLRAACEAKELGTGRGAYDTLNCPRTLLK
jgi:hypothetical protein